jgi:hypothetical protein
MNMIRIAFVVAAVACAGVAHAQNVNGNSNGNNNAGVGSGNGNGNGNGNTSSATVSTTRTRNTPSVFSPGLAAAGTESCLGSTSVGGSGAGVGFMFGTTVTDKGCNLRLFSRTLFALGHKRAATQILCNDPEAAVALSYEGIICNAPTEQRAAIAVSPTRPSATIRATAVAQKGQLCNQYDIFRGCLD